MKHIAFLIPFLVFFSASGQRFVDNPTLNIPNHAQVRLREITKDSHRFVVMVSTYSSDSLLNVLLRSFKKSISIDDSTSYNADTYNLDSIAVDTMTVDTIPWFKPFVRTRLPHGVD